MTTKQLILAEVDKLVSDLLLHDRKEDVVLSRGAIQRAIRTGEITQAEIVEQFQTRLSIALH